MWLCFSFIRRFCRDRPSYSLMVKSSRPSTCPTKGGSSWGGGGQSQRSRWGPGGRWSWGLCLVPWSGRGLGGDFAGWHCPHLKDVVSGLFLIFPIPLPRQATLLVSQPLGSQRILLTAPPPHSDHLEENQMSPPKCSVWGGYEYSQPLDPAWAGGLSLLVLPAVSGWSKLRQPGGWGSACMGSRWGCWQGRGDTEGRDAEKEVGQRIVKCFAVSHEWGRPLPFSQKWL